MNKVRVNKKYVVKVTDTRTGAAQQTSTDNPNQRIARLKHQVDVQNGIQKGYKSPNYKQFKGSKISDLVFDIIPNPLNPRVAPVGRWTAKTPVQPIHSMPAPAAKAPAAKLPEMTLAEFLKFGQFMAAGTQVIVTL
jgi:hypothetical protein